MRGLTHGGERVDEFKACAFAVGDEPRDVAAVNAAPGNQEVVAAASGDAAQLHLAPSGARVSGGLCAGRGETGVTLDALARGVELVALRLFCERARVGQKVFDNSQRVNGRALHLLDAPLVERLPHVRPLRS